MLGRTCQKFKRFNKAYSLAEVLVVMAIIMLIFLALPPVTKKVFKITDTRKAHGRFECYWDVDADGNKSLYSYFAEENGTISGPNKINGDKCSFTPTANTLYFMIHAVGGGGAGAVITTQKDASGNTIVSEDLDAPIRKVQAEVYLTPSAVGMWPAWLTSFNSVNNCNDIPWCISGSGQSKVYNSKFDVDTITDKQILRYRLGGSAGKVVSSFVPKLPGDVTLEISPGQGGKYSRTNVGSGEAGHDTKIVYVYNNSSPKEQYEAMVATGGAGGKGDVDSRMAFTLVGGAPTDFLMSTKAAVAKKLSGFIDVIESSEKYDAMKSHVPSNAGDGGSGETQFVENTAGNILYEWDNNAGVVMYNRRVKSNWENISRKIKGNQYTKDVYSTIASCDANANSATPIEVVRRGYCDFDESNSSTNQDVYKCAIGNIQESVITDLLKKNAPYWYCSYTDWESGVGYVCRDSVTSHDYSWQKFKLTVDLNYSNQVTVTPLYRSSTYSSYENESSYLTKEYKSKKTTYYDCTFDTEAYTFQCKTVLKNGSSTAVPIHKCSKTSEKSVCSNGDTPMCSNGGDYYSCNDASKKKCPAHNGGDGAAVILW